MQEAMLWVNKSNRGKDNPIGERDIKSDLQTGTLPANAIRASRTSSLQ